MWESISQRPTDSFTIMSMIIKLLTDLTESHYINEDETIEKLEKSRILIKVIFNHLKD